MSPAMTGTTGFARAWLFMARSSPYLSLFAIDFAAGAVNPLLAFMVSSNDEFADISSAGAAAVAVGNIASGYMAGFLPIRWIMTCWMLLAALANAGTALAPSFGVLLLCRVAANLADNWSLTQTLIDPNGSSAAVTGRATASVLAGRVAGGVLGGLVTQSYGRDFTCFLCAAVLVACALLDCLVIPTSTVEAQALMRAVAEDEPTPEVASNGAALEDGKEDDTSAAEAASLGDGASLGATVQETPRPASAGRASPEGEVRGKQAEGSGRGACAAGSGGGAEETQRLVPALLPDGAGHGGVDAEALGEREAAWAEVRRLAWSLSGSGGFWAHTAVLVANGLVCGTLNTTVPSTLKNAFLTTPEVVQYTLAADTAVRSLASAVLLPRLAVAVREPNRSGLLALLLAAALGLVLAVPGGLWPFVVVNSVAFSLQSVHQSAALAGMNAYVVSTARQLRGLIKGYAFAVFVGGIAVGSAVAERVEESLGRVALWIPVIVIAALCAVLNRVKPFDVDKAAADEGAGTDADED